MDLPAATGRVVAAARRAGLDPEVRIFPEGTRTARDAATAIGCEVSAIVKSLVFMVDERPVIGLVPGDLRLDPARLAAAVGGGTARRATLEEVRATTGFAAGGTPPFGHAVSLPVFADPALRRHTEVWAAAGTPTTVFAVAPEALVAAGGATWAPITISPG